MSSASGFSEKVTAWQPLAASRWTSLAASLDVEQRQDAAGDEAVRVGAAPLVDVPVVVGLDHDQVDVAVRALVQDLAGEPGEVREVEAGELAAGVHVAHPLVDVVATGPHLVVAAGVDVVHLRRLAGHGVEARGCGPGRRRTTTARRRPPRSRPGAPGRLYFAGTWASNMVRRLGDVVVDADQDQVVGVHVCPLCCRWACAASLGRHASNRGVDRATVFPPPWNTSTLPPRRPDPHRSRVAACSPSPEAPSS